MQFKIRFITNSPAVDSLAQSKSSLNAFPNRRMRKFVLTIRRAQNRVGLNPEQQKREASK